MRYNRLMLTPKNLQVLRHLYAFARDRHFWPSSYELAKRLHKSQRATYDHLQLLKAHHLVVLHEARSSSYWRLTTEACELLKVEPPEILNDQPSRILRNNPGKYAAYRRKQLLIQRLNTWKAYNPGALNQIELVE